MTLIGAQTVHMNLVLGCLSLGLLLLKVSSGRVCISTTSISRSFIGIMQHVVYHHPEQVMSTACVSSAKSRYKFVPSICGKVYACSDACILASYLNAELTDNIAIIVYISSLIRTCH